MEGDQEAWIVFQGPSALRTAPNEPPAQGWISATSISIGPSRIRDSALGLGAQASAIPPRCVALLWLKDVACGEWRCGGKTIK